MDRVITVNLAGNAFQLEDAAYSALKDYLDHAERALSVNPDREEILHDLEQPIADRLRGYLHAHKSVVTGTEMTQALSAMGPVEGVPEAPQAAAGAQSEDSWGPRRRLFRLRDGAVFAGVCTGLAAYTRLDVALVRVGVVVGALFAPWFFVVSYVVGMFAIPSANTSEEWSAAHGLPATAQDVINAGRKRFEELSDKDRWPRWTRWQQGPQRPTQASHFTAPLAPPAGFFTRVSAGVFGLALSFAGAAAFLAFLFVLGNLVLNGAVFGYAPLADMPLWLTLLLLVIAFGAVTTPLQAMRVAAYETVAGAGRQQAQAMDGAVSMGLTLILGWAAYQVWPQARALVDQAWQTFQLWESANASATEWVRLFT